MKVKHIKSIMSHIEEELSDCNDSQFPSTLVAQQILNLAASFVESADNRLKNTEMLTGRDHWLLNAFGLSRQDDKFILAFTRMFKSGADNMDILYSLSCSFFYKRLMGNDTFTVELYREIITPLISNEKVLLLEAKLKEHKIMI